MEYIHNIFLINSFRDGKRIGYDVVLSDDKVGNISQTSVVDFIVDIYNKVGRSASFSSQRIVTNSPKWSSVLAQDSFFDDVKIIKDKEQFLEYAKYNNHLCRSDIQALTILYKYGNSITCSKDDWLVDRLNSAYMKEYGEPLFINCMYDNIDVQFPENIEPYTNIIYDRILSASDGYRKFKFVMKMLSRYCPCDRGRKK